MLMRNFRAIIGWMLIICGVILVPLPIPFGLILIALGLLFVAPSSPTIRRAIRKLRRRYPGLDNQLERIRPYVPLFISRIIEVTRPDPEAAE